MASPVEHRFTVRRQDGIGPHAPTLPCAICGVQQQDHTKPKPDPVVEEVPDFGELRTDLARRFTLPQIVQIQQARVESFSEDFTRLASRVLAEVSDPQARDTALQMLENAFMATVRGLTLD